MTKSNSNINSLELANVGSPEVRQDTIFALPAGVSAYRDRCGKTRYRFRAKGRPSSEISGNPGSPEFSLACEKLLAGIDLPSSRRLRLDRRQMAGFEDFSFRAVASAKERARSRNLNFTIDSEYLLNLLRLQDFKCAVSRIPLEPPKPSNSRRLPFEPSIDRIMPQVGYVVGNVRIVSNIVNFAMNEWGESAFWELIAKAKNTS